MNELIKTEELIEVMAGKEFRALAYPPLVSLLMLATDPGNRLMTAIAVGWVLRKRKDADDRVRVLLDTLEEETE